MPAIPHMVEFSQEGYGDRLLTLVDNVSGDARRHKRGPRTQVKLVVADTGVSESSSVALDSG